jgi:hypothetical protein
LSPCPRAPACDGSGASRAAPGSSGNAVTRSEAGVRVLELRARHDDLETTGRPGEIPSPTTASFDGRDDHLTEVKAGRRRHTSSRVAVMDEGNRQNRKEDTRVVSRKQVVQTRRRRRRSPSRLRFETSGESWGVGAWSASPPPAPQAEGPRKARSGRRPGSRAAGSRPARRGRRRGGHRLLGCIILKNTGPCGPSASP